MDNQNLQDIWDFNTHPNLTIAQGKVFFHHNPKLCLHVIDRFVDMVGMKDVIDDTDYSKKTNGDQAACKR